MQDQHGSGGAPHESPPVMTVPLILLAVPALLAGFVNIPNPAVEALGHLLEGALPEESAEAMYHADFSWGIAAASTVLALGGIALAYAIYVARAISAESLRRALEPVHTLVSRKYYMDELYEGIIVRRGLYRTVTAAAQWFDTHVVDAAVNGSGEVTRRASDVLRWVQSGSVQAYGSVGFAGVVIGSVLMLLLVER